MAVAMNRTAGKAAAKGGKADEFAANAELAAHASNHHIDGGRHQNNCRDGHADATAANTRMKRKYCLAMTQCLADVAAPDKPGIAMSKRSATKARPAEAQGLHDHAAMPGGGGARHAGTPGPRPFHRPP